MASVWCNGAVKARGIGGPASSLYLHGYVVVRWWANPVVTAYYMEYLHSTDVIRFWELRVEVIGRRWSS